MLSNAVTISSITSASFWRGSRLTTRSPMTIKHRAPSEPLSVNMFDDYVSAQWMVTDYLTRLLAAKRLIDLRTTVMRPQSDNAIHAT